MPSEEQFLPRISLPEGVEADDLRFIDVALFGPYMSMRGWAAEARIGDTEHQLKSYIRLGRPVDEEFSVQHYVGLINMIGIEGGETSTFLEGYNLKVAPKDEVHNDVRAIYEAINPESKGERWLIFEFSGFSTTETMEILETLTGLFEDPTFLAKRLWIKRQLQGNVTGDLASDTPE